MNGNNIFFLDIC